MQFVKCSPLLVYFSNDRVAFVAKKLPTYLASCLIFISFPQIGFGQDTTATGKTDKEPASKIHAVLEVDGVLKLSDKEDAPKVRVDAELIYDEQLSQPSDQTRHAIRSYEKAAAEITAGPTKRKSSLREESRVIIYRGEEGRSLVTSAFGPLTRQELELVEIPVNTAWVDTLQPTEPLQPKATWTPDETKLARLLNLHLITENEFQCTMVSVDDEVARFIGEGKVQGSVNGVETELEIKCKYNVGRKIGRIYWVAMSIHEVRQRGPAMPGFDVNARLRLLLSPIAKPQAVPIPEENKITGSDLLDYRSKQQGVSMVYDRRWRVIADYGEKSVLRLVDGKDTLGHCSIARLPKLPPNRQIPLESFQADIKTALGKHFGEFLEASEDVNSNGVRVLRVAAAGTVSEVPIQWIYCHLADGEGNRASFVFTLHTDLSERFAGADHSIIGGVRLMQPSEQPVSSDESSTASLPSSETSR